MAKTSKAVGPDDVVEVTNTVNIVEENSKLAISMMTFEGRVIAAQNEISVGKDLVNSFGGYNYRSAETILAKAKPACAKYGLVLTLSDRIELIGDRFYVEATATVFDAWPKDGTLPMSMSTTAYAREPLAKKGMDDSQITGSASSYARKYALAGLWGLHAEADADETNTHGKDDPHAARVVDGPSPGFGTTPKPAAPKITFGAKRDGAGF